MYTTPAYVWLIKPDVQSTNFLLMLQTYWAKVDDSMWSVQESCYYVWQWDWSSMIDRMQMLKFKWNLVLSYVNKFVWYAYSWTVQIKDYKLGEFWVVV